MSGKQQRHHRQIKFQKQIVASDSASFGLNVTIPREFVKEYFEGVAKVETAKGSSKNSFDYTSYILPMLSAFALFTNQKELNVPSKLSETDKKEKGTSPILSEESKENDKKDLRVHINSKCFECDDPAKILSYIMETFSTDDQPTLTLEDCSILDKGSFVKILHKIIAKLEKTDDDKSSSSSQHDCCKSCEDCENCEDCNPKRDDSVKSTKKEDPVKSPKKKFCPVYDEDTNEQLREFTNTQDDKKLLLQEMVNKIDPDLTSPINNILQGLVDKIDINSSSPFNNLMQGIINGVDPDSKSTLKDIIPIIDNITTIMTDNENSKSSLEFLCSGLGGKYKIPKTTEETTDDQPPKFDGTEKEKTSPNFLD